MPSKESDIGVDERKSNVDADEDEEEDYEIDENESFTTLRKSSAFTIERYSKFFQDDMFFILQPYLESLL